MSAYRSEDVAKLHQKIVTFFQQNLVETELFLSWSAQQLRGEIYASCQVLGERSDNEGSFFLVRGEPDAVENLREKLSQNR